MRLVDVKGVNPVTLVQVAVSRRNLEALLAKLDGHPPQSYATIGKLEGDTFITLTAEEDDVHYAHESRVRDGVDGIAGPMHPDTEAAMRPYHLKGEAA